MISLEKEGVQRKQDKELWGEEVEFSIAPQDWPKATVKNMKASLQFSGIKQESQQTFS